jgi:NAD(P)-dependent dehydrogenase (short-subunit alcohol dehydrogenase family)
MATIANCPRLLCCSNPVLFHNSAMASTVFITGANSGVGLATSRLFLEKGWNVVATVRDPEVATELKKLDAGSHDGVLLVTSLDLLKPDTFQPAFDVAVSRFQNVDVLVNNAGYAQYGVIEQLPMGEVRKQFEVNVFGKLPPARLFKALKLSALKASTDTQK